MSRREFIKAAGMTAAGVMVGSLAGKQALGAPAPARVLGANDRINIGFIGVGGMGGGHLHGLKNKETDFNIVCAAVCDVWEKRKAEARGAAGCPESMVFGDYRKLLEQKDIDAVVVATPDHWHGQICIDAMQAGKHVYVEKPMTRTLDEALKMRETALANKMVVQVGSQGCTDAKWHTAGKAVRDGKIGKVLWAQGSYCRNNPHGEWNYGIDSDLTADTCDWKAWLGPARDIPFNPERYFRWRKYWDYGNGIIGDLWPHRLHPLMIAMDVMEFPKRVACLGADICNSDEGYGDKRDVADATMMVCEFPSGAMIYLAGSTVNEQGMA
ncbi:MAG: Gfo/Idh/MocA family oxidoreductase, partial [Comamonadaceae bacterium]|nr:Gfo/Idh/MocA family oxidoreductase [Comamonadaceae bacterium]